MSSKSNSSSTHIADNQADEVGDVALDAVSGGQAAQPVQRLETMVVTAKRLPAGAVIQKLDTMVVTATRLPPDLNGVQMAAADKTKKGS